MKLLPINKNHLPVLYGIQECASRKMYIRSIKFGKDQKDRVAYLIDDSIALYICFGKKTPLKKYRDEYHFGFNIKRRNALRKLAKTYDEGNTLVAMTCKKKSGEDEVCFLRVSELFELLDKRREAYRKLRGKNDPSGTIVVAIENKRRDKPRRFRVEVNRPGAKGETLTEPGEKPLEFQCRVFQKNSSKYILKR